MSRMFNHFAGLSVDPSHHNTTSSSSQGGFRDDDVVVDRPGDPFYSQDQPTQAFYDHNSAQFVKTNVVLAAAVQRAHQELELTIISSPLLDLLVYAQSTGKASYEPITSDRGVVPQPLTKNGFLAPTNRLNGAGAVIQQMLFGKFRYTYNNKDCILYVAEGHSGAGDYPITHDHYLLHGRDEATRTAVSQLILDAGSWANTLHGEVWVFDQGYWQKNAGLYQSILKASWENVIMNEAEKHVLRNDVKRFFDSKDRYQRFGIAWKRGIIYYGPPGNGKTISIKALMHDLYSLPEPIPTLYVKTLTSFGGPEASVKQIFAKARAEAPCLLVFEDLDSIVTDQVRSYFLNEVDGLQSNDGVYMIGSTNHLDRLDPGISKRPSRFDRKFEFPKPNLAERTKYSEYWRHKINRAQKGGDKDKDGSSSRNRHDNNSMTNEGQITTSEAPGRDNTVEIDGDSDLLHVTRSGESDLEFPKELSPEIAKITDDFSFAYLQEAFVATLLRIASGDIDDGDGDGDDGDNDEDDAVEGFDVILVSRDDRDKHKHKNKDKFDDLLFWRVIKKQVAVLKEQI